MSVAASPLPPRLVVSAVVVLLLGGLAVGGSGMMRVREMQRELEALEHDIVRLRAETRRLNQTVEKLRHDPAYIEQLARETLGLVRPGETVLKFPSRPPSK
ncbi:MAG: septum formation initiator family protein [Candidatus Rokubacteria bacterium]|nr:septum formation initiator family protein [Candidatus Rokubacteria bacterium]